MPASSATRSARLAAYAKLNLNLKVLNQGPDGFHELRSVFQTVTLADRISVAFTPASRTDIVLRDALAIPDNLVERATRAVLERARIKGRVELTLSKQIPMGGGMGGGSSDAAAILLALPVLAGWNPPLAVLLELGAALGSDVPYFLLGGAAVAVGRGTELYPLPDLPARRVLIVSPGVAISTPLAYSDLNRGGEGKLTERQRIQYIDSFQSRVWSMGESLSSAVSGSIVGNDFEKVVFPKHPQLKSILKTLQKAGADPAGMTGSGSALFGVFTTQDQVRQAQAALLGQRAFPAAFLSRARYRAAWWLQLQDHMDGKAWPPRSKYASRRRDEQ